MGIFAVYPKLKTSNQTKGQKEFPCLLRGMGIWLPSQVWAIGITCIPIKHGHMRLAAIIDWHSRCLVGWGLSGTPATIDSSQGSQFTSGEYAALMQRHGIRQSMDGKVRW
ncbi:MAG: hypothetical protein FWG10_13525 [Eubacteriaceae bacterium]|nr:hypothetical protein [Eubacteriaceae bacterium]